MKKLLWLVIILIYLSLQNLSTKTKFDSYVDNPNCTICRLLPDSMYSTIQNNPVLLYTYGHYGYSWSIVARAGAGFQAFSGRVGYTGECTIASMSQNSSIDSALFFLKNRDLLLWGLDSISEEAKYMSEVKNDSCATFYTNLSVINACGENVFNSNGADTFSGSDSLEFNKKYHKLCLIMRWLSDSNFRNILPEFDKL